MIINYKDNKINFSNIAIGDIFTCNGVVLMKITSIISHSEDKVVANAVCLHDGQTCVVSDYAEVTETRYIFEIEQR